jgi:hypothetical protein
MWNEILDVPLNNSEVRYPVTFKTTMSFRPTANPRRTTLDALPQDGGPALRDSAAEVAELPRQTANPRRTNLMVAPEPRQVP